MENIINTIFPPKCISCGVEGSSFCKNCLNSCSLITEGRCIVCQEGSPRGITHALCNKGDVPSMLFSSFAYEGRVRECIKRSKYKSMEFDSLKELTKRGIWYFLKNDYYFSNYVVTPIPLSKKKKKERGFNQAKLISKQLASMFGLVHQDSILVRVHETKAQYGYGRKERRQNLKGAFSINKRYKDKLKDKNILLVDDICTTGSTLLEASKMLYNEGVSDVKCYTLSYVL